MGSFIKAEKGKSITYTGIGNMLGVTYVIQKDEQNLNITIKIPVGLGKQTWQDFVLELDVYI